MPPLSWEDRRAVIDYLKDVYYATKEIDQAVAYLTQLSEDDAALWVTRCLMSHTNVPAMRDYNYIYAHAAHNVAYRLMGLARTWAYRHSFDQPFAWRPGTVGRSDVYQACIQRPVSLWYEEVRPDWGTFPKDDGGLFWRLHSVRQNHLWY